MTKNTINLLNGDCLELMKDMPDASIDLALADPPYQLTACKWDSIIDLDLMWIELNRLISETGSILITASQPFTTTLISSNTKDFKYCWIWHKNRATNFPNAKRRPLTAHEEVVVFQKGPMHYNPQKTQGHKPTNSAYGASQGTIYNGDNIRAYKGGVTERYPRTVLDFKSERGLHPTQKPLPLMEYMIKTYSNENDTVLDFCMGSGTTGLAAKNLNRNFIGIELDEGYFNIAKERIGEPNDQASN